MKEEFPDEPEDGAELNDRQRRFCELLVSGLPAGRAYEQAGYKPSSKAAADQCASRMLRNVKEVKEHVAKLRLEAMAATSLKAEHIVGFLAQAIITPISEITPDHPLCQEYEEQEGDEEVLTAEMQPSLFEGKEDVVAVRAVPRKVIKVKSFGKAEAARLLIGIMGLNKPVEVKSDAEVKITLNKVW